VDQTAENRTVNLCQDGDWDFLAVVHHPGPFSVNGTCKDIFEGRRVSEGGVFVGNEQFTSLGGFEDFETDFGIRCTVAIMLSDLSC